MTALELLLAFGFVLVNGDDLDAMKMPADHIEPGAMELVFRTASTKAEVGDSLHLEGVQAAKVLTEVLGPPTEVEGFGSYWLLGFEDEPRTGFAIGARDMQGGSVVTLQEWTAASFRYWTEAEARPLTVAVATWLEVTLMR